MRIVIGEFEKKDGVVTPSLEVIEKEINDKEIHSGAIYMNARAYSWIRHAERDKLNLVCEEYRLKDGIIAEVFNGTFELIVTRDGKDDLYGIIENTLT